MINWIFSLLTAIIAYVLTSNLIQTFNFETKSAVVFFIIGIIMWLGLGFVFTAENTSEPNQFGSAPETTVNDSTSTPNETPSAETEILKLTKELRRKEVELDNVQARLTEREFRRSLSRLASIFETQNFVLKLLDQNKLSQSDAIEQLRLEINSSISDVGLEFFNITPGTSIATLPPGSFVILNSTGEAPTGMAGTVKDVYNPAIYAKDENDKLHFILPSKINAYKL